MSTCPSPTRLCRCRRACPAAARLGSQRCCLEPPQRAAHAPRRHHRLRPPHRRLTLMRRMSFCSVPRFAGQPLTASRWRNTSHLGSSAITAGTRPHALCLGQGIARSFRAGSAEIAEQPSRADWVLQRQRPSCWSGGPTPAVSPPRRRTRDGRRRRPRSAVLWWIRVGSSRAHLPPGQPVAVRSLSFCSPRGSPGQPVYIGRWSAYSSFLEIPCDWLARWCAEKNTRRKFEGRRRSDHEERRGRMF